MLIQHRRYNGQLIQVSTIARTHVNLIMNARQAFYDLPIKPPKKTKNTHHHLIRAHISRFIYWRVCCFVCTREPKRRIRRADLQRSLYAQSQVMRLPNRTSMRRSIRTSHRSNDVSIDIPYAPRMSHAYSDTDLR